MLYDRAIFISEEAGDRVRVGYFEKLERKMALQRRFFVFWLDGSVGVLYLEGESITHAYGFAISK